MKYMLQFLISLLFTNFFTQNLFGAISLAERAALIALYNSTNGDSWTNKSGWKDGTLDLDGFQERGTEGTWYGVSVPSNTVTQIVLSSNNLVGTLPGELGDLTGLKALYLNSNQLSGSIPTQLGSLTSLLALDLNSNELTGSIPGEIGSLSSVQWILLQDNQLSGNLPTQLGNLTNLTNLCLYYNQLSGSIPSELGNLPSIKELEFTGNQLSGNIPTELENLTTLTNGDSDFKFNALYTNDASLRTFLNSKQTGGDWESTQTIAPENVSSGTATETSITVSWDPITYTGDTGGYQVYYSTTSGGPYTYFGTTANKSAGSLTVTGLDAGTVYYFVVYSKTSSHSYNSNTVISEVSAETFGEQTLPVELSSFSACCTEDGVLLRWITESETDNMGFILDKKTNGADWLTIASYQTHDALKGQGNTSAQRIYELTDPDVQPATTYAYRLSDVDTEGIVTVDDVITITTDALPEFTDLLPAFPNPFNPDTKIQYTLGEDVRVNLTVVDVAGRNVQNLLSDRHQQAGSYSIHWNGVENSGTSAASGMYFLFFQAGDIVKTQKVMLVR